MASTLAELAQLSRHLEELVFHNGERVFLPLPESLVAAADSGSEPTEVQPGRLDLPKPAAPPRSFHTVHDAAVWIETNWPDFDLEATMPVTWRGEP
jgi:hypothetical protein